MLAFFLPYLYCVFLGWIWSKLFHKKFRDCVAPALLVQIVLVLVAGLTIQRLSYGFYAGILTAFAALIYFIVKSVRNRSFSLSGEFTRLWRNGLFIFTVFYLFCFFTNYDKRFYSWDELSHWGMFLKESLRTNRLYCTSSVRFDHKDYVPAITLFEFIWVRLCCRYHEADIYRAVQVFMFSMILPVFGSFEEYAADRIVEKARSAANILKSYLPLFGGFLLVLLFPLIFKTNDAFFFYHSIYCDFAVGVLTFYALYQVYREYEDFRYQILMATLSITVLILSKMAAAAFFPMIYIFFIVRQLWFSEHNIRGKKLLWNAVPLVVPAGMWVWFNRFVARYVTTSGNNQSYAGMKFSAVGEVFGKASNSSIPYLHDVRRTFFKALFSRDVLIHGSYAVALGCLVVLMVIMAFLNSGVLKKKIYLTALWILAAGICYALIMYFLYETAFSESEARNLASYERYMNSFLVAAVLMTIAVYFSAGLWQRYRKGYRILIAGLCIDLFFLHIDAFTQIVPGNLTHDEDTVAEFERSANIIIDNTRQNASVFVLKRGDSGKFLRYMRYYSDPRDITGYSVGPAVSSSDTSSRNITPEEFVSEVSGCGYLYLDTVDSAFVEKYESCFSDPSVIANKALYNIEGVTEGKLDLSYVYSENKNSD